MEDTVYLEVFSTYENDNNTLITLLSIESFITFSVFKYCAPKNISLKFVYGRTPNKYTLKLLVEKSVTFVSNDKIPWQVISCLYPVVVNGDTTITGLCAVLRHICKNGQITHFSQLHEEGLLGFRNSCLQAPNEVSIWTKFCEVDLVKTVSVLLALKTVDINYVIPKNLVRFENHLNKPVRMHNVFKLAHELNKQKTQNNVESIKLMPPKHNDNFMRVSKNRKWKSNKTKPQIEGNVSFNDLEIKHQFAEGSFLSLADLVLLPLFHISIQLFGESHFKSTLPLTYSWYNDVNSIPELKPFTDNLKRLVISQLTFENVITPEFENLSLYKCDPKRSNPKKRLYTKESYIENALDVLTDGMEFKVLDNQFETGIDWSSIPDGANPTCGHLPDSRISRKCQQLENLALPVLNIAKDGDLIVDFCSGSGHLGILLAHLLPKCTVILLENKEQSLLRAKERVHAMKLSNVYLFQCNLDFFIGTFDIGIALHACGVASDLVLDKCLKVNAKFVLCPCCYGSLHVTDRLSYPRSTKFENMTIEQYMCIGHAADQTHNDHPLAVRGTRCMSVIDSDRAHFAEEKGYQVNLFRLKPPICTPKNNLIIGLPSQL